MNILVLAKNGYLSTVFFMASKRSYTTISARATTSSATISNRWRFSGKEGQSFLGAGIPLLDFGARMYNPAIARWTAADPLSEKHYGISPYVYCLGNPISIIDPNGESTWVTRGMNGTFIVTDKGDPFDNDSNIYETYEDDNGVWQRGESIGQTVSHTHFIISMPKMVEHGP